jgi:NADH:ubiquinone oxidoreductase subunit 2 (subunit N)
MEFIFDISEKINPLQGIVIIAVAILISSFFSQSKKRSIKRFIIAITAVSLLSAFYLNICVFISLGSISDGLITFGTLQVIEVGILIFGALNVLFFISTYEVDRNNFIKLLMLLLFLVICAIFTIIADSFILFFTSLTMFVLTAFQLVTGLDLNTSASGDYAVRFFLRPVLTLILFFFGFSSIYGAAGLKGFSEISGSQAVSNPIIAIGVIIFSSAVYIYLFLFPFQNPYMGLLKRSNASSNAVIWFLYFLAGFFVIFKFSELFSLFVGKGSFYITIVLIALTFICMFAGNLGAAGTASTRRIISFLFLYFIGVFLLNMAMFSAGVISSLSMKWLNMANVFLLTLSFIPVYSIFSRIEKLTGSDSISSVKGLVRSNIYIGVNLIIIIMSWLVTSLYILPFGKYFTGGAGILGMGTTKIVLLALISITFIFLVVNIFRLVVNFLKRPSDEITGKIIFSKFYYIYITFFTLAILIVAVKCLMEISGIDIGFMDFKITGLIF